MMCVFKLAYNGMWLAFSGFFQPERKQIYRKDLKNKREQKEKRFSLAHSDKSRTKPLTQTIVNNSNFLKLKIIFSPLAGKIIIIVNVSRLQEVAMNQDQAFTNINKTLN